MVVQVEPVNELSKKLLKDKPIDDITKPYKLQRRVFEDTFWNNSWFRGMEDKWGDWELVRCFTDIKISKECLDMLERRKIWLKYKTEYRVIKEEIQI